MASCCRGEIYQSVCDSGPTDGDSDGGSGGRGGGGSLMLLYEVAVQSLLASESVLEFIARSIEYFKSQVNSCHFMSGCVVLSCVVL
jgi:hypothetical protein